ncbi:MAG: DUF1674 domain-containing protein [Thalassobaculaceae bacterium]|nr:DUF1674 domain-containing protein [Thalassobaculaceae bacterium]
MSDKKPQFREVAVPQSREVAKPSSRPKRIPAPGEEVTVPAQLDPRAAAKDLPPERGGYDGPEPTRFGDWEHKGRTTDF